MEKMGSTRRESCMIGDQIFTDVMAGRLAGCYTIMVERFGRKEIWYVALKRPLERIVRFFGRF
ncbi:MAG: HAD hydrolase-like protein, partial [Clostridiales bacterium]|nr:HAD hydrolase-like protein [Clostridiales bacterium]